MIPGTSRLRRDARSCSVTTAKTLSWRARAMAISSCSTVHRLAAPIIERRSRARTPAGRFVAHLRAGKIRTPASGGFTRQCCRNAIARIRGSSRQRDGRPVAVAGLGIERHGRSGGAGGGERSRVWSVHGQRQPARDALHPRCGDRQAALHERRCCHGARESGDGARGGEWPRLFQHQSTTRSTASAFRRNIDHGKLSFVAALGRCAAVSRSTPARSRRAVREGELADRRRRRAAKRWQRNETTLTPENVRNMKILWKLQLDNVPREMHALLPPLIVGEIATAGRSRRRSRSSPGRPTTSTRSTSPRDRFSGRNISTIRLPERAAASATRCVREGRRRRR